MSLLARPSVRIAATWLAALAAYVVTAWVEGLDDARRHPRDERAMEARADLLAAHVTDVVGRARDGERRGLGALCDAIVRGELDAPARQVPSRIAGSALRDVTVLRTADDVVIVEAGHRRGPPLRAGELGERAARREGDERSAAVVPSPEGLGVVRLACIARDPSGVELAVVGHLDVLALAGTALPETLAQVALEREEDRAPGLRRWLGPAGEGPRPALRVRLEAPPPASVYPIAPAIAALLVALAVFAALRPRRTRALTAIEEAARRVGAGDLDVTLDSEGGAEEGTFAAFNRMTRELKDAQSRLARAERTAAWREVAQRIAHEIKNPLTPIRLAIETLRKAKARAHPDLDEIFEESTRAVLEEVQRMERIVSEFSHFARMPRPELTTLDLREVAAQVVQVHALPAEVTQPEGRPAAEVRLEAPGGPLLVEGDRAQLAQVLTNLVQNAIDAARQGAPERPRVLVRLAESAQGPRIEVHDNGPGIPEEERARVLAPYHTTKPHGTGLGLAIVDRIVSEHGGSLTIERSAPLGGAQVTVLLRRQGPDAEGGQGCSESRGASGSSVVGPSS